MVNKIILLFAFLLLPVFAVIAEEDATLADAYYKNACKFYNDNKPDDALNMLNKALQYQPEYPQAFYKMGECYEKLKNNPQSLKSYRLCRKCLLQQMNITKEDEQLLGQAEKKIEQLDINSKQLGKTKNNYTSELLKLANSCMAKKYYKFTERLANQILTIDPDNKAALELLEKLGKNEQPSKAVTKADPKEAARHKEQADNLYYANKYDQALYEYELAIKLDPKNAETYNNRALTYYKKGDFDRSIADFNEAIKLRPASHRAYCNRGLAYGRKGDLNKAIADFTRAIELNKKHVESYGARAYAYAQKGNYDAAIADAQMLLKLSPTHKSAPDMRHYIEEWRNKR
ncbi:MAG: tetratricopeptide repeat protein [Candidatus Brocadiia bacterium]